MYIKLDVDKVANLGLPMETRDVRVQVVLDDQVLDELSHASMDGENLFWEVRVDYVRFASWSQSSGIVC